MDVLYRHEKPGVAYGNILWRDKRPAKNGRFPADHPCAPRTDVFGKVGDGQCGEGSQLQAFRDRGYWASCFPEGDGITMKVKNGQAPEQVIADIEQVFGWKVRPDWNW
jgi:hypothetical protein